MPGAEPVAALPLTPLAAPPGTLLLLPSPGRGRGVTADLDDLAAAGVAVLVSLTEASELYLDAIRIAVGDQPFAWLHLPIEDLSVPLPTWEVAWQAAAPTLHDALDRGRAVAVHCQGGCGRSGLVAARLLVERGLPPRLAVRTVRRVRPGAIETGAQLRYVLER